MRPIDSTAGAYPGGHWLVMIARRLGRKPEERCVCGYSNLACDVLPYFHPDRVKRRLAKSAPFTQALPVPVLEARLEALRKTGLDQAMIRQLWPDKTTHEAREAWRGLAFDGMVIVCPPPKRLGERPSRGRAEAWLKTRDDRFFASPGGTT